MLIKLVKKHLVNHERCMAESWLEKQDEQKPSNKVEPKFKAGDWVVSNEYPNCGNSLMRIVEVGLTDYLCRYYNGQTTYCHKFIDKSYHLWTIQDAKDGDVLATEDNCICIYDNTVEEGKYPFAYCGLSIYGFKIYDRTLPFTHNNVYPATKKQRDLLFQKMKEAGYEWDAEKKKLKKIETLTSLDEAIEHCKEKSCGNNACALEHKQLEKWLTELKELKEQKPIWSKEDESRISWLIKHFNQGEGLYDDLINWFKSLKPNHWKPSEKQMEELARITRGNSYPHLSSLYDELKKL